MLLAGHMPFHKFEILATDIDLKALDKAGKGVFNEKSLKDLPEEMKDRFFTKIGNEYAISDKIKKEVSFRQLNLLENNFPQNLDLIVCRNVLIYFTDEAKNELYRKFNRSLRDDGILFVGSTEQIIKASDFGFESMYSFFYRKVRSI